MNLIDLDDLKKFPIRNNHYDEEHGDLKFVLGIESLMEYAESLPTAFDIDMVINQIEEYGKWKGILRIEEDEKCENYIPVSVTKQIVKSRGLGGVLGYMEEENE